MPEGGQIPPGRNKRQIIDRIAELHRQLAEEYAALAEAENA
jgi:hypothetical protein